jgi:hypothetical protein
LCVADRARRFPNGNPTRLLSSIGQKKRTGTFRTAPRTFIFKLRVIAFIFRTSVEEFGGRPRKALILLRIEQYRTNGKRTRFGIY